MKNVDILIPTHNRCGTLKSCLDLLSKQTYPKAKLSIIVFDDASNDQTPHEIPVYLNKIRKNGFKNISYFRSEQNVNVSAGRVILAKKIAQDSEIIFFLDDDAYLEPCTISILVKYLDEHPETGIVGPKILLLKTEELLLQD